MQEPVLTPMLVQYLVALCCLRWDREAIDVTVGDMVQDAAARKERDVDVTVTVAAPDGTRHAFKAYEVKRENKPLDVADVEALILKLQDMPSITHRAIVSASGFTDGAQSKAAHHGIKLLMLKPWTRPLQEQFPLLTMTGTADECFPMRQTLLCWSRFQLSLVLPTAKSSFNINLDDRLLNSKGKGHPKFKTFKDYRHEILVRSTEILFPLEPAASVARTFPIPFIASEQAPAVGPEWPHTHTLDVASDGVHVLVDKEPCRVDTITVTGHLRWERSRDRAQYHVVEEIPGGEAFSAALVASEVREGHMTCLVFSPKTREIGIHFVRLADKHLNAIRKLKVEIPEKSDA